MIDLTRIIQAMSQLAPDASYSVGESGEIVDYLSDFGTPQPSREQLDQTIAELAPEALSPLTPLQVRLLLRRLPLPMTGVDVETLITAHAPPELQGEIMDYWEFAQVFQFEHVHLQTLLPIIGQIQGMAPEQLREAWIEAAETTP